MGKHTVYHVSPHRSGWQVRREGAKRAASVNPTRDAAVAHARQLCLANQPSHLIVHREDGSIANEHVYDQPPRPAR